MPRAATGNKITYGLVAFSWLLASAAHAADLGPVAGIPDSLQQELEIQIWSCRPVRGTALLQAELSARALGQREITIEKIECGAYRPGTSDVKLLNPVDGLARIIPGKTVRNWVLFPFDETFSECRCVASGVQPLGSPATPRESARHARVAEARSHDEPEQHAAPQAPGRHFAARVIDEPGAGGHHHAVVTVEGLALLVLRDEGVYKRPLDRAEALARGLEETLQQGDRVFVFNRGSGLRGIYATSHHGRFPRLLLRVTPADAVAYTSRSGRQISQTLLGEWWAALLKDFFSVLFVEQAPRFITATHEGEALAIFHAELSGIDRGSGPLSERIQRAIAAVDPRERDHLRSLAFSVPRDFAAPAEEGPHERPL